jgi:hypothetical protein
LALFRPILSQILEKRSLNGMISSWNSLRIVDGNHKMRVLQQHRRRLASRGVERQPDAALVRLRLRALQHEMRKPHMPLLVAVGYRQGSKLLTRTDNASHMLWEAPQ